MFLSSNSLAITYNIHDTIAKFFVDREPPQGNLYWKDKLLYLRPQPGYLFIPMAVDTFYKLGIPMQVLLDDAYVQRLEAIGHIAAQEEAKLITHAQAVDACIALTGNHYHNKDYYDALVDYMKGGTGNFIAALAWPYNALHRGDIFLFSLCVLQFDNALAHQLVRHWFALITSLLLMDDAEDLEDDKRTGEPNAFLQCGLHKEGVEKIKQLLNDNLSIIEEVNVTMMHSIDNRFVLMAQKPHIQQYLN
jgi:hypothetical protein